VEYVKSRVGDEDVKSLSAYVNEALAARVREERRRRAILENHLARARESADHARVDRMVAHVKKQLADLPGYSGDVAR
jgi:glutamyl-tRNA reductase